MQIDRTVVAFFVLLLVVYFLESIGGFYMTSAIVYIEKQFQIPSKVSGLMVSASDFGYIPSVVFVSYLGGKGNRARWIGGGCVLIALANILISSSNFLFPAETVSLNTSVLEESIERDMRRLNATLTADDFLAGIVPGPIRDGISQFLREEPEAQGIPPLQLDNSSWVDKLRHCDSLETTNRTDPTCEEFFKFLTDRNAATQVDIDNLRLMSATSYAFCDKALNNLRNMIQSIKCSRGISNVGPTATIFLGLLLLGVGRTMPFSLGLPLIDDNVKKANLPVYFAGMFLIRIMGPVVGLMMGSFFNQFYYSADPPSGLTPRDPMWIGRWWGGFLVIGIILFGPSMGLFCFRAPTPASPVDESVGDKATDEDEGGGTPKKKPRGLALVDRHIEKTADGETVMPETLKDKIKDFKQTIWTVIRQPVYAGSLVGRILDVMAFRGFFIFLPKYLEIQFGIPQYLVNFYMGIFGVIGFMIGVLMGSVMMRRFKLEGRKAAGWVAICSAAAACLSFVNAGVGCRSTLTALGEAVPYNFNTNATCISGCGCDAAPLYPVCNQNGTVFYSPCHAGCRLDTEAFALLDPKASPTFGDCMCAGGDGVHPEPVAREFCSEGDCGWQVKKYFANMVISGIFGGMGVIPGVLIMLRSVPRKHRSVSLGFNGFLVSLFATLPSPIVWGAVIDTFCVYWEKGKCDDSRGACALYATDDLRVWLHTVYGAIRIVSLITDVFVVYHAKDLRLMDEDDETGDKSKKVSTSHESDARKSQHADLVEKAASLNRAADMRHARNPSTELAKLLTEMDEVDMQRRGSTQEPGLM